MVRARMQSTRYSRSRSVASATATATAPRRRVSTSTMATSIFRKVVEGKGCLLSNYWSIFRRVRLGYFFDFSSGTAVLWYSTRAIYLSSTWMYWTPRRRVHRAWRRMCYRLARRRRRWRRRHGAGMPTGRQRREGRRDIFLQTRRLRA